MGSGGRPGRDRTGVQAVDNRNDPDPPGDVGPTRQVPGRASGKVIPAGGTAMFWTAAENATPDGMSRGGASRFRSAGQPIARSRSSASIRWGGPRAHARIPDARFADPDPVLRLSIDRRGILSASASPDAALLRVTPHWPARRGATTCSRPSDTAEAHDALILLRPPFDSHHFRNLTLN